MFYKFKRGLVLLKFVCKIQNIPDANESFGSAKTWITTTFTWLYVGSQDVWALAIIAIYFSKYGKLKMGQFLINKNLA